MRERVAQWLRSWGDLRMDLLFAAIMLCAMLSIGMYTAQSNIVGSAAILPGSSVNGIDISGLDPDAAMEAVIQAEEESALAAVELIMTLQGEDYIFTAKDFGAATDAREAISPLFEAMRTGSLMERTYAIYRLRDGVTVPIAITYDQETVEKTCRSFAESFYIAPVDAAMRLADSGEAFEYVPEQAGRRMDSFTLYREVWSRLQQGEFTRLQVAMQDVRPTLSLAYLMENTTALSEHTIQMDENTDAATALRLLESLNGYAIPGGGDLSLRAILYPDGVVPPEEEAAASQVASTLYNALLLAGTDKVERHRAERPVDYVPKGQEARLSSEHDLVMHNGRASNLHILAGLTDDQIKIEIHGRIRRLDETIRIRTEVREIEPASPGFVDDPSLVTQPEMGYRVSSFVEVLRDGVRVTSDLLSLDVYPPIQGSYVRNN